MGHSRLAHGWELARQPGVAESLISDFLRPAVRAVPSSMASRLGPCCIVLVPRFDDPAETSRWVQTEKGLEISVAVSPEEHDTGMDMLVCLGQALWERISAPERKAFWRLIDAEIRAGVAGEIDEDALAAKQRLLANLESARSPELLEQYGQASFAATAAEYVHCLWHDVTVRVGPEHLPERQLGRRLKHFARWFPPNPGSRLFPARETPRSF